MKTKQKKLFKLKKKYPYKSKKKLLYVGTKKQMNDKLKYWKPTNIYFLKKYYSKYALYRKR